MRWVKPDVLNQKLFKLAGNYFPRITRRDHFPGRLGLFAPHLRSTEECQAALGESLRRIRQGDVLSVANVQSLGPDAGGNYRDASGHGLIDFEARASSSAERNDGHR